jgi:hypothetical protein
MLVIKRSLTVDLVYCRNFLRVKYVLQRYLTYTYMKGIFRKALSYKLSFYVDLKNFN